MRKIILSVLILFLCSVAVNAQSAKPLPQDTGGEFYIQCQSPTEKDFEGATTQKEIDSIMVSRSMALGSCIGAVRGVANTLFYLDQIDLSFNPNNKQLFDEVMLWLKNHSETRSKEGIFCIILALKEAYPLKSQFNKN